MSFLQTQWHCTADRRESASLWEGNAADMKFLNMMRKYLEQYEAESVAL